MEMTWEECSEKFQEKFQRKVGQKVLEDTWVKWRGEWPVNLLARCLRDELIRYFCS